MEEGGGGKGMVGEGVTQGVGEEGWERTHGSKRRDAAREDCMGR
jgi:hypothetical protein